MAILSSSHPPAPFLPPILKARAKYQHVRLETPDPAPPPTPRQHTIFQHFATCTLLTICYVRTNLTSQGCPLPSLFHILVSAAPYPLQQKFPFAASLRMASASLAPR